MLPKLDHLLKLSSDARILALKKEEDLRIARETIEIEKIHSKANEYFCQLPELMIEAAKQEKNIVKIDCGNEYNSEKIAKTIEAFVKDESSEFYTKVLKERFKYTGMASSLSDEDEYYEKWMFVISWYNKEINNEKN